MTIISLLICRLSFANAGETVSDILRNNNITREPANQIINIFVETAQRGLPTKSLLARLREGIIKEADAADILSALQRRLNALIESEQILYETGHGRRRNAVTDEYLETLARALESGLPRNIFERLLTDKRGALSGRMQAIIEAGEILHLTGVDTESVDSFMHDCLARELRRMETVRATRFWMEKHREGMDSEEIRRLLWNMEPVNHRGQGNKNLKRQRRKNSVFLNSIP